MHVALPMGAPDAVAVLTKAALRVAAALQIAPKDLAEILGISTATISGMRRHGRPLPADPKGLELTKMLIRIYRALDAITGGDDAVSAAWLRNENSALRGIPLERMKTIPGLAEVLAYLDQRRAPL
ncbi:MAG: MbcA/ParS/Xre antitoxin family protein [Paracoccaceae bacterium]